MRRLFLALILFLFTFQSVFAEITSPYTVDEKSQVLFGDSVATSTYEGLQNYTHGYVNNYLHITFTYTHSRLTSSSYPPLLYVTAVDPRATSTPTERTTDVVFQLEAFPVPPGHETDWYSYDVQFDATGYTVEVLQAGSTEITNEHRDIPGLTNTDWAALANNYPNSSNAFSMAFTPRKIYDAPVTLVATTTPVIIVPGIMSSKLLEGSNLIWPNTIQIVSSITDEFLDVLKMDSSGNSLNLDIVTGEVIKTLNNANYFQGLFDSLSLNDYQENTDVFENAYDWRLDIENTVQELKEKIVEIKAERGVDKVDLVAHSMGGLLVKKYLKDFGGSSVDKFIDIGTPHTGAPSAFKILNYGDDLGVRKLFSLININSDRIKEISQNMPAIYQLLPSSEYFDDSDNDYKYYIFDAVGGSDRLTFGQTGDYLKSSGRNSALVDRAAAFHAEIDTLNPSTYGVETYNIVGCGTPTIGQFYVLDDTDGHYIYNVKFINGDGTVPLKSAEAMSASSTYYVKSAQHALMPSTSGVKELVAGILTSTSTSFNISPYSNLSMSSVGCTIPDGRIVSFHSPIQLHVYDSSGNHTGPDANGDVVNNISGVVYETIGDNKFAFLPNGVNYTIKGNATNSGTFDVRIQELVNGEVATTTIFANLPLTSVTQAQFALGLSLPTYIDLDSNNDGIFEYNYDASTTTSGILEATGKIEIVQKVVPVSSVGTFEPVPTIATSSTEIPGVTIFSATSTPAKIAVFIKPKTAEVSEVAEVIEIAQVKSQEAPQYSKTAIAYKSFNIKVKITMLKMLLWVKEKF